MCTFSCALSHVHFLMCTFLCALSYVHSLMSTLERPAAPAGLAARALDSPRQLLDQGPLGSDGDPHRGHHLDAAVTQPDQVLEGAARHLGLAKDCRGAPAAALTSECALRPRAAQVAAPRSGARGRGVRRLRRRLMRRASSSSGGRLKRASRMRSELYMNKSMAVVV